MKKNMNKYIYVCVCVCVTESHCCTAVIDTTLKFNCALIKKKKISVRLPWWLSEWESAWQCRGYRFNPWSRRSPHALEQLSLCTTNSPCSAAAAAKSLQSCRTLCDPIDGSPPGSSVPESLQARILKWVAISFCNACVHAKSLQPCPTLCDPMDSSPPDFSVHRIL